MPGVTVIRNPGQPRTIVRHKGIPGEQGIDGAPGEVTSATSVSVNNEVVLFNGTSGTDIKRSTVLISDLATTAALAGKVDTTPGYGLSEEDFTTTLKDKLDALSEGTHRGTFDDEAALTAGVPIGNEGDRAYVVSPIPGDEQTLYIWDSVNDVWVKTAPGSTPSTGAEIKTALFAEPDTNNLNDARLALLNNAVQTSTFESVIQELTGSANTTLRTPIVDSTTARTLTVSDAGKVLRLTNAAPCTITLEDDPTAVWVGFVEIYFVLLDATPALSIAPGVTVNNSGAVAGLVQYDTFTLKRVGVNEWDCFLGI